MVLVLAHGGAADSQSGIELARDRTSARAATVDDQSPGAADVDQLVLRHCVRRAPLRSRRRRRGAPDTLAPTRETHLAVRQALPQIFAWLSQAHFEPDLPRDAPRQSRQPAFVLLLQVTEPLRHSDQWSRVLSFSKRVVRPTA